MYGERQIQCAIGDQDTDETWQGKAHDGVQHEHENYKTKLEHRSLGALGTM